MRHKRYQPEPEDIELEDFERKIVTDREFVQAWMNSSSLKEVAEELEITKMVASTKATNLRKKGVNLPMMYELRDENSVNELNTLIERMKKRG